ncbi:MAG: response regulator [Archaeoglobaceae archaeon]
MIGGKKYKIMVVEDDADIVEVYKLLLKNSFEIVVAKNGKEAVEIYELVKPDLIIMDIEMPVMNGIEATRKILEKDPNAVVIGVTVSSRSNIKKLIETGAKEVLEKPFKKSSFIETIRRYLRVENFKV